MSKALFVIDMQEAAVGENHAPMFHYDENSNIDDDDFFQRRSDY